MVKRFYKNQGKHNCFIFGIFQIQNKQSFSVLLISVIQSRGRGYEGEVGIQNPKFENMTLFIDVSGEFSVFRLFFSRPTLNIGDCATWSAPSAVNLAIFYRYDGSGDSSEMGGAKR